MYREFLNCRRTYVVWRSFEKISTETAEKLFGKKKLDAKYNGALSVIHQGRSLHEKRNFLYEKERTYLEWSVFCGKSFFPTITEPSRLGIDACRLSIYPTGRDLQIWQTAFVNSALSSRFHHVTLTL